MSVSLLAVSLSPNRNYDEFDKLLEAASPEKKAKAAAFRCRDDAWRTLVGEALARTAVGERLGIAPNRIEFGSSAYGKPYVVGAPELHFNVSHSGSWVVCAVARQPVGVDVERMQPVDLSVAHRFFSRQEQRDLADKLPHEQEEYFYDLWTLKESYIKCHGHGLSLRLDSFTVRVEPGGQVTAWMPQGEPPYSFRRYAFVPGYKLALCSGESELPERWQTVSVQQIVEELLR
ncbi:4'-phosphopantetheinyl transferase family protein [Paenibacillus chartarius]|uniref:4'-phosphopantetheinyl transferase family protein n=1 Tax=Paenibacillus chartarius TaxID=747481 RepID=A0ABV6DHC4_9BACL